MISKNSPPPRPRFCHYIQAVSPPGTREGIIGRVPPLEAAPNLASTPATGAAVVIPANPPFIATTATPPTRRTPPPTPIPMATLLFPPESPPFPSPLPDSPLPLPGSATTSPLDASSAKTVFEKAASSRSRNTSGVLTIVGCLSTSVPAFHIQARGSYRPRNDVQALPWISTASA